MPTQFIEPAHQTSTERYVRFVIRYRILMACAVLFCVALAAVSASDLRKDATANAYIEPDNPALQYRDRVVETFGLKEPIVLVVRAPRANGVLDRAHLELVRELVTRLERLPNIDSDRIASIVSRSHIAGDVEGLNIGPLLPEGELSPDVIDRVRIAFDAMSIYEGTLFSRDRSATSIVAELLDETRSAESYREVMALVESLPTPLGTKIHVAGAGAITGYFSSYIDRDAGRLVPFAAVGIGVVLFCAFLAVRAAVIPMLIAFATVIVTLGTMAAVDVPFYAITNGMVVVLMGISVAEPMHVFGEYYARMRDCPDESNEAALTAALTSVWRPIALTALTTLGGFLSLWLTSTMPPVRYFGLFGAFGVFVAWVLTITLLPALTAMLPKRQSRLMRVGSDDRGDVIGHWVLAIGRVVLRRPRTVVTATVVIAAGALAAASNVRVDHARIENFNVSEPLYVADREINATLAGTNHLDIVVEAQAADGLLTPDLLHKIEALQQFLSALPEVGRVISIVDYLEQLHGAMQGGSAQVFRVPDDADLIAQLMLTYQASAPPAEFQSLIDSSGRSALVRVYLPVDRWSEQRKVVHAARDYLDREFNDDALKATLTGRVMLDYEWVRSVASGHAMSVVVATLTVLLTCIVLFWSIRDGLLCLAPLFVSVAGVYAVMGLADIWLGVATSMFASIAIGLGIDFAIHMVARARKAREHTQGIDAGLEYMYRTTGRAVLFNAAAVGLGFGIVTFSAAPPIRMFGVLVATAMVGAFLAAITVLPALMKLVAERAARRTRNEVRQAFEGVAPMLMAIVLVYTCFNGSVVQAEDSGNVEATRIMAALESRRDGDTSDRRAVIRLIDRQGGVREQVARAVRKNVTDGRRMAIFYEKPANIRGTAFLVFDYRDPEALDDQWLYLPALRKVRRIPASDRGDYFLGTDLTFDEVRNDNRVTLADWVFQPVGGSSVDGVECITVEGRAATDRIAKELGYSRARWAVDTNTQIARRIEYWDRAGALLKTVNNRAVTQIDGVWTALRVDVENHKTGHRTNIEFRDARFDVPLPDALFTQQQMERGL